MVFLLLQVTSLLRDHPPFEIQRDFLMTRVSSFPPPQLQVVHHMLLGIGFQQLLQRISRPPLEVALKALLHVCTNA